MRNIYTPANANFTSKLEINNSTRQSCEIDSIATNGDVLSELDAINTDVVYVVPKNTEQPAPTDVTGVYVHDWTGRILAENKAPQVKSLADLHRVVFDLLEELTYAGYEVVFESDTNRGRNSIVIEHIMKVDARHPTHALIKSFIGFLTTFTGDIQKEDYSAEDKAYQEVKRMLSNNEPFIYQTSNTTYTLKSIKKTVQKEVTTLVDILEAI